MSGTHGAADIQPLILTIEPELDERAATATMARAQRVYEEGARDISKVMREQLTAGTSAAGRGFDELETKARKAYLGMQDASDRVAAAQRRHDAALEKGAMNAEWLGRKVERARLAEIEAIQRATDAYNEYGDAAKGAGSATQEIFRGLADGMSGGRFSALGQSGAGQLMAGLRSGAGEASAAGASLGGIVAAAAGGALAAGGVALMAGFVHAVEDGASQLRVRDLFQAQLGVDTGTMENIGHAAGAAYTKGVGDSVEENLKTITAGIRSGLIGPKSSDADLSKFTERMNTTSKITGQDPAEIAAKSRNILRNGLASDYTQIMDVLNSEAGKQLNISGELLDTVEEYSTAWHGVGLSLADATGLMKQMSDAGIRNTDVAADSLKELAINVSDDSKTTRAALKALGFDADDMNKRFAEGGATAREAFGAVLKALQDMKDPQDKNNIGLALFKTKWEDAHTAIEAADLPKAADDLGKIDGATDDATKKLNEHADGWDNLGRTISQMWSDLERMFADSWLGKFVEHGLPNWLNDFIDFHPQQTFDINGQKYTNNGGYIDPNAAPSRPQNANPLLAPTPAGPSAAPPTAAGGLAGLLLDNMQSAGTPDQTAVEHGPQGHMVTGGGGGKASLPPAPVLPLQYSSTAGLPSSIANATTSLDDARHEVAEKEARLHQLEQTNVATADDITKAHNDLTKAQQNQLRAEQSLTDARVNATKQATKQMGKLSSDLDDMGAKLDKDFGISKGLGGIVENAVKALGNILAAPFLQALGFVEKANPNEGSGLVGMMAANGVFGAQYTPAMLAAQGRGGMLAGTGIGMSGYGGGAPSEAQVKQIAAGFGLQVTSENRPGDPGYHGNGMAIDFSNGTGNTAQMEAFANYMSTNFGTSLKELIYSSPTFGGLIKDGQAAPGTSVYNAGTLAEHQNHVHVAAAWGDGAQQAAGSLMNLAGAAQAATAAFSGSGFNWGPVAAKESGGNWANADTGGNGHYGGLQFSPQTWNAFGGQQYAPMPNLATPEQQMAVADNTAFYGYNGTPPQGLGAWQVISNGSTAGDGITVNSRPPGGGGGRPGMGMGMPTGLPIGAGLPGIGAGQAYPSQGGNSGNFFGGMAMDGVMAAASGLDMMFPGAGSLAKIGIQVANRTIGYAAQNAGIAASGLMETLSVGDNPRGSLGNSWLGKLAGGLAGAAPALPNLAGGGKKPPGAMQQAGGGQQQGGNVDNSQTNINVTNQRATEDQTGKIIAEHQAAMYAPAGRQ